MNPALIMRCRCKVRIRVCEEIQFCQFANRNSEWGPYLAIDLAYFYMQRHLRTRTSEDATNALTLAREFASKKDEIAGLDIAELVDSYLFVLAQSNRSALLKSDNDQFLAWYDEFENVLTESYTSATSDNQAFDWRSTFAQMQNLAARLRAAKA